MLGTEIKVRKYPGMKTIKMSMNQICTLLFENQKNYAALRKDPDQSLRSIHKIFYNNEDLLSVGYSYTNTTVTFKNGDDTILSGDMNDTNRQIQVKVEGFIDELDF